MFIIGAALLAVHDEAGPKSVQVRNGGLFATLQVAHLDANGALSLPNGTHHILMEIGCSNRDTLDDEVLRWDEHAFLVSFEPLLDKYSELAARGNERYNKGARDMIVPLGHHHPRAIVLPLAVGERAGAPTFRVGHRAGCSSLLQLAHPATGGWATWCKDMVEERTVPSITLRSAIALSGDVMPIRLLKIDAQGADLGIVRAAPKVALGRVQLLTMELQADTPYCRDEGQIYSARETCQAAVAYMRTVGFRYVGYAAGRRRLVPPDARNAENGSCPTHVHSERKFGRMTVMCEIQAYFVNEEGQWPPLLASAIVPYVVP